ncbi:MAG: diguanylate cyclase [Vicinamibacteria bacterium]
MRLRTFGLLALFLAAAALGCGTRTGFNDSLARAGRLDLSKWDPKADGPAPLRGEWMFRPGELLGPSILGSIESPIDPEGRMINAPRPWNGLEVNGEHLTGIGFATRALRVTLPPGRNELGLRLGEANSADRIWVNHRLVSERGRVGRTREEEVPSVRGRIVPLGDVDGVLDIVVETSNHLHNEGGPVQGVSLGREQDLERVAQVDTRIDFFLMGCLLIIGCFYAALSLGRLDREILLFSMLSLLLALRIATVRWYITDLLPITSSGQLRLDYVTLIFLPVIFCALIAELFPDDVPSPVVRIAIVYAAVTLIGPLFLDTQTFTRARDALIVMGSLFGITSVFSVARAALRRRKGASPLLVCSLVALGIGLRDAVVGMRLLPDDRERLPIAVAIIVFAHAVVLGRRLTTALEATQQMAASLRDVNARLEERIAERTQDLERVAMTDPLTGLWNRRPLLRLAEAERGRITRSGEVLGVMIIDCDDFKRINDAHGHSAGDEVLRILGQRFSALVRSHDLLGRWGGEEFVMILSTADEKGALATAERVRLCVGSEPFELSSTVSLHLTVSIGIALVKDAAESFDNVLGRADQALYAAKAEGKNRAILSVREAPQAG